ADAASGSVCAVLASVSLGIDSGCASSPNVGNAPPMLRSRSKAACRRSTSTISGSSSKPIAFSVSRRQRESLIERHLGQGNDPDPRLLQRLAASLPHGNGGRFVAMQTKRIDRMLDRLAVAGNNFAMQYHVHGLLGGCLRNSDHGVRILSRP